MGLDHGRMARASAFDGVGVNGSLGQHPLLRIQPQLFQGPIFHLQEGFADDFALGLGRMHPAQGRQKGFRSVEDFQVVKALPVHEIQHVHAFILAHEAVVDMQSQYAFGPQRPVQQLEGHGGVHSAADQEENLFPRALFPELFFQRLRVVPHIPFKAAAA
jgi:hypothetical protein